MKNQAAKNRLGSDDFFMLLPVKKDDKKKHVVNLKASDCGATGGPGPGGGGFSHGNTCATGEGGSGRSKHENLSKEDKENARPRKNVKKKYIDKYLAENPDAEEVSKKVSERIENAYHMPDRVTPAELAERLKDDYWNDPNQLGKNPGYVEPKPVDKDDKEAIGERHYDKEQWKTYQMLGEHIYERASLDDFGVHRVKSQNTIEELEKYLAVQGVMVNGHIPDQKQEFFNQYEFYEDLDKMTGDALSRRDGMFYADYRSREWSDEKRDAYHHMLASVAFAKKVYLKDEVLHLPVLMVEDNKKSFLGWFKQPKSAGFDWVRAEDGTRVLERGHKTGTIHMNMSKDALKPPRKPKSISRDYTEYTGGIDERKYPQPYGITGYPSPAGTFVHEVGHALHFENVIRSGIRKDHKWEEGKFRGPWQYLQQTELGKQPRRTTEWKRNVRYLSEYANTNPMEFVAEAYSMKIMFPELWEALPDSFKDYYYDKLKGP
tara:strand:+ start:2942 stop:4408 length:1467 start_codon:yes stop_codon:yes gene_type:complete